MKIALVENFGSDFYNARLRYALFLKEKGHNVTAIVPNDGFVDKIRDAGIEVLSIEIDVRKRSVFNIYSYGRNLCKIFNKEKYDVVHLYRMQPNIIGTFSAYISFKGSTIVNHITGLGVAFMSSGSKYWAIKNIIKLCYKVNYWLFNAKLVFQNEEDKDELGGSENFFVVKGSAVNESKFNIHLESSLRKTEGDILTNDGVIRLLFVSRLLKSKGLSYLVDAVGQLNAELDARKVELKVVGWIDPHNPESYTEADIDRFREIKGVSILGKRNDINRLIATADAAILPTFYREGTPRFLLEAMAMGKPIITTDMPGCSHLIKKKENGILIKPKNVLEIVEAINYLRSVDLQRMGHNSAEIYKNEFSEEVVYNQLLNIYFL